jgi:hypothetical protein
VGVGSGPGVRRSSAWGRAPGGFVRVSEATASTAQHCTAPRTPRRCGGGVKVNQPIAGPARRRTRQLLPWVGSPPPARAVWCGTAAPRQDAFRR